MKKRILCYGDSNTWGAIPNETERYPDDVRWTGVLQHTLGADYGIIEEGYNGRTTVHDDPIEGRLSGTTYFKTCLESQQPLDLIILMLGTNDLKTRFNVNPKSIAYGLDRYVDILKSAPKVGPKPKLLIVSPILVDPAYKEHALFHDMFGETAHERSLGLADAYREIADADGVYYFNAAAHAKASVKDGVHMEPEGHAVLGRALAEKVREILG